MKLYAKQKFEIYAKKNAKQKFAFHHQRNDFNNSFTSWFIIKGSRTIAPHPSKKKKKKKKLPPTPKLTLSQSQTLTEWQFLSGATVWLPPSLKPTLILT